MSWMHTFLLFACLSISFHLYAVDSHTDADYVIPVSQNEIKIMSYNVHNLFDTEHDKDKQDYEFLPANHPDKKSCHKARNPGACRKLDWSEEKVALKIQQTVKVIEAQGDLPDIIVLSEVENANIVGRLADELGYDGFSISNSPDVRGIDCAILHRKNKLTQISFEEREIKNPYSLTRNLSAATFRLNTALGGGVLSVFANHWPSQGNPVEARLRVVAQLKTFVEDLRSKYSANEYNYILTGDFNTIDSDIPNPITTVLLDPDWSAKLVDVKEYSKQCKNPMIAKMPPATYYYGVNSAWNEFDRFFVNAELTDRHGLDVDPMSFRIHAPSFLSKRNQAGEKVPFRYNHNIVNPQHVGYSDHFAIVMKLRNAH